MVERDLLRLQRLATVLANIAVPDEDIALGSELLPIRNMDEMDEPDHRRGGKTGIYRPEREERRFLQDGNPFENHHYRPPHIAYMDGFVGGIQNQNASTQPSG